MYTLSDNDRLKPVLPQDESVSRRQDAPDTYVLNGAVYVARSKWLREHKTFLTERTIAHSMPHIRSLDIDDGSDLEIAECLKQTR